MATLKELRERRGSLEAKYRNVIAKAESEDRDISGDEASQLSDILKEDKELMLRIERQEHAAIWSNGLDQPSNPRFHLGGGTVAGAFGGPQDLNGVQHPNGASRPSGGGMRFVDSTGRERQALGPKDSFLGHFQNRDDFEGNDLDGGERLNVGRCIRAVCTGRMDLLSDRYRNSLTGNGSAGYMLSPSLGMGLVDLARSASVCVAAGAQTVGMSERTMTIVKLLSDPVPTWRNEATNVSIGDPTFGAIVLTANTLAVRVPISQELLEDGKNIDGMLESAIRSAMGSALDQAALVGEGFSQYPRGIVKTPGVNTEGLTSIGTPTSYSKFSTAIGAVLSQNFPGQPSDLAWIQRPDLATLLDQLVSEDSGQPLQPTPFCQAARKLYSNGLTAGTSIVGDFSQVVFGLRTDGIRVQVTQAGADADGTPLADKLMLQLICYLRADVAILRPGWFSILTGITLT